MEIKLVIEGLDTALAELKAKHADHAASLGIVIGSLDTALENQEVLNGKLDTVHTMLSHLADTQAAHGIHLNAIMAALYTPK